MLLTKLTGQIRRQLDGSRWPRAPRSPRSPRSLRHTRCSLLPLPRVLVGRVNRGRSLSVVASIGVVLIALSATLPDRITLFVSPAAATEISGFTATLGPDDRRTFEAWWAAQMFHRAAEDAYWARVARVRGIRRNKIRKRSLLTEKDYVTTFPPQFDGPSIGKSLYDRWAAFRDGGGPVRPRKRTELPDLADFLEAARTNYDFVPERIPEVEFKRRYAAESLRLGLTKSQVVRVYALETGGFGTADMVAGVHPIRKTGRPISSAMGYAQLLAANTLLVLQKHGDTFDRRLRDELARANDPGRRASLGVKIDRLGRMRAYVDRLPKQWSALQDRARTPEGRGVHAINIDGDIGPWVQVVKLRDTKGYADRIGKTKLTPEQLELMNLAGPGTGLEMMTALGSQMPTSNFFSRRGYSRNTIVRGKRASELLEALGQRMDVNEKNAGAVEFTEVFDSLINAQPNRRPPASLNR